MVYPCTVGRHTCRPHLCHTAFLFWVWAAVYALFPTLVKQREGTPPPPINGVDNAPLRPLPACRGQPRQYDCLIQRFSVWSGFMALWAGIATPQQAEEIVARQYLDTTLFCCPAGVRSLSPLEKMYNTKASGNPSSWQGPVWICVNYLVFRGLLRYGYTAEARLLAWKTIILLGRDFERFGALHEYYLPENGEPVLNRGFQNWNFLVLNMIAWLDGRPLAEEF